MTAASQPEHRHAQPQDRPGDLFAEPTAAPRAGAVLFRGGVFTVMVLRVGDPKSQAFYDAVMAKIAQSPAFFRNAPIVLDLQDLAEAPPFNVAELVRRLKQHQLVPVGVQNATDEQVRTAANAGLSLFPEGRAVTLDAATSRLTSEPVAAPRPSPEVPAEAVAPASAGGAVIVTRTVRSGQQIAAPKADMVVLASTSPGAELLADGHIHVYGTLRGRAHAGVGGNVQARIFCRALEAELVSIAGFWRVREDLPEALIGQPAHIYLDGERVQVEPLV